MKPFKAINARESITNIGADFVSVVFRYFEGDYSHATFLRNENPRLFNRARTEAIKGDFEALSKLSLNILDSLEAIDARVEVCNGHVFFEGREMHNFATEKICQLHKQGLPIGGWVNFVKNTMANPHAITVEDIYCFLDNHEGSPITEDGAILAYKKVGNDYMSFFKSNYTKKRECWKPGSVVTLPYDHCDPDRNKTCSAGLHFCSRSYAPHTFGCDGRLVMVKIFPQDIVAIPVEYGLAKGRCCKAEVLQDITDAYDNFSFGSLYSRSGDEITVENDIDASDLMGSVMFAHIEHTLILYANALIDAEGDLTANVGDLIDKLEKFAMSIGDDNFVYDEEDVLYVLEHSEDEKIDKMYDVEFEADVFVKVTL